MAACPAFDPFGAYVGNVVGFVDCHAAALGEDGYRALGPGSPFGVALSGLLTIFVALLGYRLLVGRGLGLQGAVGMAFKLGVVLTLATQWAAYQPLVFDMVTRGPEDLAASILSPSGLGGQDSAGLMARVQAVNRALNLLANPPPIAPQVAAAASPDAQITPGATPAPPPPPATNQLNEGGMKAVGEANGILLVATLTGMVAVRVIMALMLALGPIFAGCLLFDATRRVFASWLRVLAGAMLAALAVPAVLALELAVIEPQVVGLANLLEAKLPPGMLPEQIWASAALFAMVMVAVLVGVVRAASGIHLPEGVSREYARLFGSAPGEPGSVAQRIPTAAAPTESRSRAQHVADAALAMGRRDARMTAAETTMIRQPVPANSAAAAPGSAPPVAPPLGQGGRDSGRMARRHSSGANRRDART